MEINHVTVPYSSRDPSNQLPLQDPRVRTTAIQNLVTAAEEGSDIPYSVYQKIISSLSDSHHEVRLHSVQLLPHLVKQHRAEIITAETGRSIALTHHTFIQLCMLMRDINTGTLYSNILINNSILHLLELGVLIIVLLQVSEQRQHVFWVPLPMWTRST